MEPGNASSAIRTAAPGRGRRLPALYVPIAPSRRLAVMLTGLHGLAVAVSMVASVAAPAKIVLIAAIVASGIRSVRRHALLLGAAACMAIRVRDSGRCEVVRRDGTCVAGQIDGGSYVLPELVIVRVRRHGAHRTTDVILMSDAVDPVALRRLRVRLRSAEGTPDAKPVRDLSL